MAEIIGFMSQPLKTGERIMLSVDPGDCPLPVGSAGRFVRQVGSRVLVEFDEESHSLHNGEGACHDHRGYYVYPQFIAPETFSPYDHMLADFNKQLGDIGKYLVIHGNVFELSEVNIRTATDVLRHRDAQVSNTYLHALEALRSYERGIRDMHARKLLFPQLTATHIARDVTAYRDGSIMHICKPFKYAPQNIKHGSSTRTISDRHKEMLVKPGLIIDITTLDFSSILRTKQSMRIFTHYHCMGNNDCIGSLDPAPFISGDEYRLIDRIETFAKKIEELFVTINLDDVACREPYGLPTADDVWADARAGAVIEGVLTSAPPPRAARSVPTPPPAEQRPMFPIGCHVHIVGSSDEADGGFTDEDIAVVRNCYLDEPEHREDPYYAVEFITEYPGRHDCDGYAAPGHGWYAKQSELVFLSEPADLRDFPDGARVVVIHDIPERLYRLATVRAEGNTGEQVAVEFDSPIPGGHDCNCRIRSSCGRWYDVGELQLLSPLDHDLLDMGVVRPLVSTERNSREGVLTVD